MKKIVFLFLNLISVASFAQQTDSLTVEKIMQDPKWIGTSPSNIFWSPDGSKLYFDWNPEKATSDSLYYIVLPSLTPQKATPAQREEAEAMANGTYNTDRTQLAYSQHGDIYLLDVKTNQIRQVTDDNDEEYNPQFSFNDKEIIFQQDDNLYAWNPATGLTSQLTNFVKGEAPKKEKKQDAQSEFLEKDALENSTVLQERKHDAELRKASLENLPKGSRPDTIYIGDNMVNNLIISPDGKYITYLLMKRPEDAKRTIVPEYVTQSGYTETIPGRPDVGAPQLHSEMWIYDREKDTTYEVDTKDIPGIHDKPDYLKYYPTEDSAWNKDNPFRKVIVLGPVWNDNGTHALVVVRSLDNKDRWIMELEAATGKLKLLDRQRDEAWIDGPGIGWTYSMGDVGWINNNTCWFQSEATGYSHLYSCNVITGEKKAMTSGHYEVQTAQLSNDKKYFYITTNEVEPVQTQFYRLTIADGKQVRLTHMEGGNEATISPDEKHIAFLYSFSNYPWELYVKENKENAVPAQVTHLAESAAFKAYPWRAPQIITFTDRYGKKVYARLFRPKEMVPAHPGVIFVHGAGYLQDAIKWWSDYYFREYMFENLLADHGYTIMDVDYSGSAGYGRDWRTAIYRHMGGKDLDDEVDAAHYMADSLGVDPKRIGIWGGSYGGFMTLMAMFTTKDVFQCGAAIRSVTDWAHYNHGYTSNILNEPYNDSLAYKQSSPIYFANGLQGHLLMCHGMEDTNVHFQDIVRLTEKLIELHKHNWELAVYPLENHEFEDPSSWTDEYTRIFKLFEENLK